MSNRLQIEIDAANPVPGLTPLKVTPIDLPLPDAVGASLALAIAEMSGGKGELDEPVNVHLPIRFSLFGLHVDRNVELEGTVRLRVVTA